MSFFNCRIFQPTKISWRNGSIRVRFNIAITFLGEDKEPRGFTIEGCTCRINDEGQLVWAPPYGFKSTHFNIFPTKQTYIDIRNGLAQDRGIADILEKDYRGRLAKKALQYDSSLPTGIQIYGETEAEEDPSGGSSRPVEGGLGAVFEASGAFQSGRRQQPELDDSLRDIFREVDG